MEEKLIVVIKAPIFPKIFPVTRPFNNIIIMPTIAMIIVVHVIKFGLSLIQTKDITAVKNGPDDKMNNVEATEECIIEKTYPQKETERKIPTIKSFESKDLKKLVTDWFRLRHVKSKTIKLSPIDR